MIPLRDVIPSRTRPFVTVTLILVNAAVFIVGRLAPGMDDAIARVAVASPSWPWATVLAMFLHSGWLPLASNLLMLWIVGGNVEDRMGHGRYLVFYLLAGASAAAAAIWNAPDATPLAGASGAIAGLIGAYLVLFPNSRVLVLVPGWMTLDVIEVPALIVLALWFLIQIAAGFGAGVDAGGAPWSLAGGLGAGLALVWVFRRREREAVEWWSNNK